jgi:CBS domain-containing protein
MNRELFGVGEEDTVDMALRAILLLGITGAPVLDEDGKPLGLVSLRDLVADRPGATVGERMTRPAATVAAGARIAEAARALARTGYHRLVVVDEAGTAVGMVSSVDLIRGLMGLPAPHPQSFPHLDWETGLSWTDDRPLERGEIAAAPEGAGVLLLVHGSAGAPESVVWAEAPEDIRGRLAEILTAAQPGLLGSWLEHGGLRFRAAAASDPAERSGALAVVLRRAAPPPPSVPAAVAEGDRGAGPPPGRRSPTPSAS